MTKKNKTFDCVEMKKEVQAELLKEYERRKSEFASYSEFLTAKLEESPEMKIFWDSISSTKGMASA